jgi:uncharacterized protein YacL
LPASLAAGIALSPGTISGDTGKTLATFLGLVSASILPTISLLINSMTASGRSVKAIDELEREIQIAMDALFLLFGCVAVVIGALVALAIKPPALLTHMPYITSDILPRSGQGLVLLFSTIILLRVGQIPGILRRSLAVRHKIAVDEARRKTIEKAPTAAAARASFATHPEFGKSVPFDPPSSREH